MKKVIKYLTVLFAMMLLMAGCGNQLQEKTYKMNKSGVNIEITLSAHGDKVSKQKTTTKIDLEKMNLTKEIAEETFKPLSKEYQGVKGVKESMDITDTKMTEKVTVDYDKVSQKDLKKIYSHLGVKNQKVDLKKGVSFSKTTKQLKKLGMKEVK